MSVYKKLMEVQGTLKAPKNQFNKFGGYNYRSCEDILEAVKPLLSQAGLVMNISDEVVMVGERIYVKATAAVIDVESGESVTASALARESESQKGMSDSQITGSASSYARKYALNGLLMIDDTKDADSTNTHGKEPKGDTRVSEAELKTKVMAYINKNNYDDKKIKAVCDRYKINSLSELTAEHCNDFISCCEKKGLKVS